MINALAMEFYKTRRRGVWLVVAVLMAVQLMWALWALRNLDAHRLAHGWMLCLYQFPLLNSIMMPVIAAVMASRLSDIEHKGQTLKLLGTIMPAGRIFDAKFLCGAAYMLAAVLLQLSVIVLAGRIKQFGGDAPLPELGYYLLFTAAVSLTILLLQQVLSLLFANQMVPLTIGLIGGLSGLFILFFPQSMQQFILTGYYGVLMLAGMDWDKETRIADYYWLPVNWAGFASIIVIFFVIYAVGRTLFMRKEM